LTAALHHSRGKANPGTSAAKRWVPWLCAFTGARVGEMAQLRKEDITHRNGCWIVRITPEAGPVKTNEAREVVLHPQVVSLGFPDFVEGAPDGPLFLTLAASGDVSGPLQGLKNRLTEFARQSYQIRTLRRTMAGGIGSRRSAWRSAFRQGSSMPFRGKRQGQWLTPTAT